MDENNAPPNPLPENLAMCIRLLNTNIRELDINKINLGENLIEFQQAVEYVTETVCEDDDRKLSLTKAASTLYNSAVIWTKIVEDSARLCLRMDAVLSHTENEKDGDDEDPDKRKRQPRAHAAHLHPLAIPLDDSVAAAHSILAAETGQRKRPAHKFLATDIPQLPQEKYLAVAQPSSLGLMEHEKIRAYLDDRGNKGADWAEFRCNTMKLNPEGYFPLQELHPDEYHAVAIVLQPPGRPSLDNLDAYMVVDDAVYPMPGPVPGDKPGNAPNDAEMDAAPHDFDGGLTLHQEEVPNPTVMMPPPNIPPSRGRPERPHHTPLVPFQKIFAVRASLQERNLVDRNSPKEPENDAIPFRRRSRRIMRKTQPPARSPEVVFFENFWTIPTTGGGDGIHCQFGRVLRRYFERLQPVEVKRPNNKRKHGAENGPVQFTSRTSNVGNPFAPDVPNFQIPEDVEDAPGDYEDTHMPIDLPNNTIPDAPEHDDLFATMRKEGRFLRETNENPPVRDYEMASDIDSESSRVVHVDLCEWENQLNTFLTIHEPTTLGFNLEEYEKALVVDCHQHRDDKQMLAAVVRKSSVGEVCRSFLSVLDLANKSVVEVGRDEEPKSGSVGSQGVEEVMVRVRIQSSEVRKFCGTKARRTERIDEADETEIAMDAY